MSEADRMRQDQDAAVDAAIVADFLAEVTVVAPRLAGDPARMEELADRGSAMLQLAHAELRGEPLPELSTGRQDVGAVRARTGVHPAESLRAAGALFRQALPRLLAAHRDLPPERVAVVLHEVIDQLVAPAAVSYVDVLLARISDANRDERRRVARDLHDHTSHGIGAAMQGVDLALHLLTTGQLPDIDRLRTTRQVLLDTLNDVRGLATRLRDVVGDRSRGQAREAYLHFTAPVGLDVRLTEETGAAPPLPSHVKEESYLIVREAIRNSLVHGAGATRLDVAVVVTDGALEATVSDDGAGFDPATVDSTRTVGLASLRERAEGLGGSIDLQAGPGGVRVALTVPLAPVIR
jgi:signal transduction histidine kinase